MREEEAGVLDEARRLAARGPVSIHGRAAYLGAVAALPGPPAALVAALLRLAGQDRALGLHALAAMQRASVDAAIRGAEDDAPRQVELRPVRRPQAAPRRDYRTRSRA